MKGRYFMIVAGSVTRIIRQDAGLELSRKKSWSDKLEFMGGRIVVGNGQDGLFTA